ncbi:MAG: hypothetical protein ABW061_03050 [Polyangiaceae bacterium]
MPVSISQFSSGLCAGLVLGGAVFAAGCASTTGLGWVAETHSEPSSVIGSSRSRAASIPATAEPEPTADVRPRLNHTVTLGEIDVAPVERVAGVAAADAWGGPSVTINNYNVMNVATPAYGYASVGSGRSAPSFATGSASRTSAPGVTPGQSWPTIVDHGPSFPYRSGPASPWARTQ